MAFLPHGCDISSHILFLCRALISSCIVVIHKATSELFKVSWKVDSSPSSIRGQYATLIYVTYSECHIGGRLSRVDQQIFEVSNSTGSYSSCSGAALEEFKSSGLFSTYIGTISYFSFTVLSSSSLF